MAGSSCAVTYSIIYPNTDTYCYSDTYAYRNPYTHSCGICNANASIIFYSGTYSVTNIDADAGCYNYSNSFSNTSTNNNTSTIVDTDPCTVTAAIFTKRICQ